MDSRTPRSSRGQNKEGGHLLPWRHPLQALSGAVVQILVDPLEFLFRDPCEGGLLRMEPSHQPVGVLVRAAFPGMVGLGKEHAHNRLPLDLLVARKFLAVVERQALSAGRRHRRKQPADRRGDLLGLSAVRRSACSAPPA